MIKLKKKIRVISSLPPSLDDKNKTFNTLLTLIILILVGLGLYIGYKKVLPYINAVNINKISGKKTAITSCNTKDYIIIGNDKSYTMKLTNKDCKEIHYEGTLKIKNNEIIFENNIVGTIDNKYNIIINNIKFESSETNE